MKYAHCHSSKPRRKTAVKATYGSKLISCGCGRQWTTRPHKQAMALVERSIAEGVKHAMHEHFHGEEHDADVLGRRLDFAEACRAKAAELIRNPRR